MATKTMRPFSWDALTVPGQEIFVFFESVEDAKHFEDSKPPRIAQALFGRNAATCIKDVFLRFGAEPGEMAFVMFYNNKLCGWNKASIAPTICPHSVWYLYDPMPTEARPEIDDLI